MPHFLKNETFYNFNEEQLQKIEETIIHKHFRRGAIIFNEADPADGIYIIKSGYVKVYQNSESGKEKTLAILAAGDIIGEMATFGQHVRSATVKALEPTHVYFIPQYRFEELLITVPALSLKIAEIVTERLRWANKQMSQLVSGTSRDKVICQLLYLAERYSMLHKKGIIIQPRLTHSDIASLVGVARETVTKILNDLEDRGIVTFESKRLIIRDIKKLQDERSLSV